MSQNKHEGTFENVDDLIAFLKEKFGVDNVKVIKDEVLVRATESEAVSTEDALAKMYTSAVYDCRVHDAQNILHAIYRAEAERKSKQESDTALLEKAEAKFYDALATKRANQAKAVGFVAGFTPEKYAQTYKDVVADGQKDTVQPDIKAIRLLEAAAKHMRDRAATYDKPQGEHSMAQTVNAFNAITGKNLTEAEGWLLMLLLKQVRIFTNPAKPHQDSIEDAVAYASLLGDSMLRKE